MSGDDLAKQISELMRTQDNAVDPRLSDLAAARLSPEAREQLQTEADQNPELAEALALFEPLSASSLKRLSATATLASRPAPKRRVIAGGVIGSLLAAAAAGAIFLRTGGTPPIPEYRLAAQGGDAVWRGTTSALDTDTEVSSLRQDSELGIVLQPQTSARGPIEGALWVIADDTATRSPVGSSTSEEGAVAWFGTASELTNGRVGQVVLVVVVGRPSALPGIRKARRKRRGRGWRAFELPVHIRPRGER